jgi:hypothetical protein
MTFREFKELTWGVHEYQLFVNGKFIVGLDVLDSEYMDMNIIELDFTVDDNGRITCTVDLK